jgi:hypothetical protein
MRNHLPRALRTCPKREVFAETRQILSRSLSGISLVQISSAVLIGFEKKKAETL